MVYFKCKPFAQQYAKSEGSTNAAPQDSVEQYWWLDCISKALNSDLKKRQRSEQTSP